MYQVPGSDIVFACIMCAIAMVMCFMFGRAYSFKSIRTQVMEQGKDLVRYADCINTLNYEMAERHQAWVNHLDIVNDMWTEHFELECKGLVKKQREAMKKYRAKCDRQVVHHMETYTANQMLAASKFDQPDFSTFLSK